MNDEVKVRSFRISDSVAEKFKAFCGEFDSQNAALDSLITTYEMQNAKSVLMDRKTETACENRIQQPVIFQRRNDHAVTGGESKGNGADRTV